MIALKIDTISIQSYIFGSNKLKENIGGSFIIERLVYWDMIPRALRICGLVEQINMSEWVMEPDVYQLLIDENVRVEIGYIGGGNAILIFRYGEDLNLFVRTYTTLLLQYFPGLNTAYGKYDFEFQEGGDYKNFMRELNENLIQNRYYYPAQTVPFKHGIVDDCPWTNEAKEFGVWEEETIYISKMAASKVKLVNLAQEYLTKKFEEVIGNEFTFTTELEKLGQPADKGYIAIVHADGNGMGQRFMSCQSLAETRRLSREVGRYADEVMRQLLTYVVQNRTSLHWEEWDKKDNQTKLPIRPLILGGDDITFVCEGRLGVHLAEKLLEIMTSVRVGVENITACAGVAVVHTKSPFYKAYELTEELTKVAKKASGDNRVGSWLHFLILTGGFSGSYETIRKTQYELPNKRTLKGGPYRVDPDENSFSSIRKGMSCFAQKWPRNKLKELRDVLRRGESAQEYFMQEISARNLILPENANTLWKEDGSTPYYDMLELLDFYPEALLKPCDTK